jgi:hypothetical protein
MPKSEIDYSNTIIYKITCKDTNVKDVYVGHTTNFVQRKHAHKQSCINNKSANHKCKLYEVIRNNGGWDNWKMEIINFFQCHDHCEARQKEQEYFISLHATLNSIEPMSKPKPKPKEIIVKVKKIKQHFHCSKCNVYCVNLQLFEKHNESKKHVKKSDITILTEKYQKQSEKFHCEKCDFNTNKRRNYDLHITTRKHINNNKIVTNDDDIIKNKIHLCDCGKVYSHRQGLHFHKKTCASQLKPVQKSSDNPTENIIALQCEEKSNEQTQVSVLTSMVMEFVKDILDLQNTDTKNVS